MKCSEYAKEMGVRNLSLLSEISGVQLRTLQNWYGSRRFVFDAVIEKALKEGGRGGSLMWYDCPKCGNRVIFVIGGDAKCKKC